MRFLRVTIIQNSNFVVLAHNATTWTWPKRGPGRPLRVHCAPGFKQKSNIDFFICTTSRCQHIFMFVFVVALLLSVVVNLVLAQTFHLCVSAVHSFLELEGRSFRSEFLAFGCRVH